MSSEQPTQPWYTQTWAIVLALWLFFPLGLYLMWRFARWQTWIRTTITVAGSLLTILFIVGAAIGEEDDTAKAVRQEASPSPAVEAPSPTVEPTKTPKPTATVKPTSTTVPPTATPVPLDQRLERGHVAAAAPVDQGEVVELRHGSPARLVPVAR